MHKQISISRLSNLSTLVYEIAKIIKKENYPSEIFCNDITIFPKFLMWLPNRLYFMPYANCNTYSVRRDKKCNIYPYAVMHDSFYSLHDETLTERFITSLYGFSIKEILEIIPNVEKTLEWIKSGECKRLLCYYSI